jgi:hypothetical protein
MNVNHHKHTQIILLVLSLAIVISNFSACSEEETAKSTGKVNRFDQTLWKAQLGSQATDNPRGKMLRDLKDQHLKIGMSQSEVEAVLGKADRIRNGQYLYRLGMGQYSVDYSYLALVYDEEGRLKAILDARS